MKLLFYYMCFLMFFYIYVHHSRAYRQEHAKVKYYNPKYLEKPKAITSRGRRGEPYRTNITASTLHPWGNNVTLLILYSVEGTGTDLKFKEAICDITKTKWVVDFVKKSSALKLTCPMPAQFYGFYNIEVPPRNFPLSLPKGDTNVLVGFYLTDNREPLVEYIARLNFK